MNSQNNVNPPDSDFSLSSEIISTVFLVLIAASIGLLLSAVVLTFWIPGLSASVLGPEPKVFWYVSRAMAIVAFVILWFSMAWGLLLSGRLALRWPGMAAANELHQFTSLLGLGFGLLHGLLLLGDHYINFSLVQVLVPFATESYRPLWVGLGQITLYLWLVIFASFYVRKQIGQSAWRLIHYVSFLAFIMALLHGIFSGSDTQSPLMAVLYWFSAASLIVLTVWRVLNTRAQARQRQMQRSAH
jgi:predicted ferric reductase